MRDNQKDSDEDISQRQQKSSVDDKLSRMQTHFSTCFKISRDDEQPSTSKKHESKSTMENQNSSFKMKKDDDCDQSLPTTYQLPS